ncbi:Intermediate conductance calcium-activated potassium channel protein 4, partial [Ophiophagus hannah]
FPSLPFLSFLSLLSFSLLPTLVLAACWLLKRQGWGAAQGVFSPCLPAPGTKRSSAPSNAQEMQIKQDPAETRALHIPTEPGENLRRLRGRKRLLGEERNLAGWSLLVAMLGIFLMVLHTELAWFGHCEWFAYSFMTKCLITLSTVGLMILILAFHIKELQLFMLDNALTDWRIAVSTPKLALIMLELLVCSLHPFPGGNFFCLDPKETKTLVFLSDVDMLLSLVMFLRLYLVPRAVLLRSSVLGDASYRSIGSLNKIHFQYPFVLRVMVNSQPGRVLLIFTMGLWITAFWILSVCERQYMDENNYLGGAFWLIPITFLTIGYGDVVPKTGVGCTALLVAVAADKLEFTRAEKHVHNFMMDIQCDKEMKCSAANVLQEAWLLHKHTKRKDGLRTRKHHRRLLAAIHISSLDCSHKELEKQIASLDRKLDEVTRLLSALVQSKQQEEQQVAIERILTSHFPTPGSRYGLIEHVTALFMDSIGQSST